MNLYPWIVLVHVSGVLLSFGGFVAILALMLLKPF